MENVIAHEMMQVLMMEALTAGMAGGDENMNSAQGFSSWFVEGIAQATGGGALDSRHRFEIDGNSKEADITAALQANTLASGTGNAQYATGYLATMYLGYLAARGNSMEISDNTN